LISLLRRDRKLTVDKLADEADIELATLVNVENDMHYKPDVRTVCRLANFFGVPRTTLLQVAGVALPRDSRIMEEAVRFAARSASAEALSSEERAALATFVAVLRDDPRIDAPIV
jgi:transcriptional regulator with XRE-family HTH domain